jgi:hypothetical protein
MRVRVTWINGNESDFHMTTLRELDAFVGQHAREGIVADFKPLRDGIRLLFSCERQAA